MGTSSSSGPEPPGAGPAERFRTRRSPLADLADEAGAHDPYPHRYSGRSLRSCRAPRR
jgi:hypothetical protein